MTATVMKIVGLGFFCK